MEYLVVGASYLVIGILGYFEFRGNGFPKKSCLQNALDMFAPENPFAFVIRFLVLIYMLTVYPMFFFLSEIKFF